MSRLFTWIVYTLDYLYLPIKSNVRCNDIALLPRQNQIRGRQAFNEHLNVAQVSASCARVRFCVHLQEALEACPSILAPHSASALE